MSNEIFINDYDTKGDTIAKLRWLQVKEKMSKYVERIMDEVYDNFHRHFDYDDKLDFLEELIERLQIELEYIKHEE